MKVALNTINQAHLRRQSKDITIWEKVMKTTDGLLQSTIKMKYTNKQQRDWIKCKAYIHPFPDFLLNAFLHPLFRTVVSYCIQMTKPPLIEVISAYFKEGIYNTRISLE